VAAENYVFDAWYLSREQADHIGAYGKGWISRLKANRIINDQNRRMSIKRFETTLPRESFREINELDKTYRVYSQVLDVNKLGKVRVVVCYDSQNMDGKNNAKLKNTEDTNFTIGDTAAIDKERGWVSL